MKQPEPEKPAISDYALHLIGSGLEIPNPETVRAIAKELLSRRAPK